MESDQRNDILLINFFKLNYNNYIISFLIRLVIFFISNFSS
jgi:hypothetical protein